MATDSRFSGTPQHQALLAAIVEYYQNDARAQGVLLFGSLARGNWDSYSDLDLDVVIADDVQMDVLDELKRLCAALAAIGHIDAIIVPDGADAADVVFGSLLQFSIRYHPLATTNPNIVDSLRVLAGSLDHETIAAAGRANRRPQRATFAGWLDQAVRCIVVADVAVQRGQLWSAVEMLHRFRGFVMELYALAHGGARPLLAFQAEADVAFQTRLGATLPQYDQATVRQALARCIDFLEQDLGSLTVGQAQLSSAQQALLAAVRARQK
jgi:predicted nucleotidyltransferase